ncbi:MFS transporter [Chelatococcus reniformis]|uniref:MFS transporter n=1 Tax=Chelatococcus reniformis TaxID=1494448 RepID=A0A916UP62_9HYPH|nr:MFS transporter [Chelatococcus reniformis]
MLNGIGAPLRIPLFRRIWSASLLSNLGLMIHGVGAAWAMTRMTSSADMVALVQTALMLPVMLLAVTAGAVADMFDRRIVGLLAMSLGLTSAATLSVLTHLDLLTPNVILIFTFLIGCAMALFGPSWQASVSEQVPPDTLPSAVALNGISYNIARSFGPALGGIIVATAGAVAAFVCNAVLYLPLLVVFFLWRRDVEPSRLPPERLGRAIVSGVRYISHSPSLRIVLWRTLATGICGSSVLALMALIARDLLGGGAQTFGMMLGAFGMGAVIGALNIETVRRFITSETAIRISVVTMGLGLAIVAVSRAPVLTAAALVVAGAGWMLAITLFNINIQLSAPRWVAGRALATFQAAISGGIAMGSWFWGHIADGFGTDYALLFSAAALLLTPLLGLWLRMPAAGSRDEQTVDPLADPEVALSIKGRSGPIVIEIEYRVDPQRAREFYGVMQEVQASRQRNGAYGWSIARDLGDTHLWTERYHCPTWNDFLRQRSRATRLERQLFQTASDFHLGIEPIRVRRMLERPFGSVRWKDETPDRAPDLLPAQANVVSGV